MTTGAHLSGGCAVVEWVAGYRQRRRIFRVPFHTRAHHINTPTCRNDENQHAFHQARWFTPPY